ncbi:MAG: primosomal protein N', partial [Saprospiraceae bacterium]|nr:primosomal protein N' [Saprospiraceae bacterium]
ITAPGSLSNAQEVALAEIRTQLKVKPILLRGVTGSGKTRIYIDLIQRALEQGEQVLYLVPEIALTTQMVGRLKRVFGDQLLTYHSRMSGDLRAEIWQEVRHSQRIVLGARSAVFLPFQKLGLVIVDEEHDQSYKQTDPAPRYQARDTAVVLAGHHQAGIVLGSATPSIESHYNAQLEKYHEVVLTERFGEVQLPEIILADLRKEVRGEFFSQLLIEEIRDTHAQGLQTILFQNRRGFAPVMFCSNCGWHKECKNCDTTMVFHRYRNEMRCHLCGYVERPLQQCPDCSSSEITLKGFGTEMIEEELKLLLPHYRIARLDLDTARGRKKLSKLIHKFENREYDILVGTQMVTKGLDFGSVGLVGVVNADQLLHYPDFRASERAFQLMTQVAGRAGRRKRRGKVIIQSRRVGHPIIREVIQGDYMGFTTRELEERKAFLFPPYVRMIRIVVRHGRLNRASEAAQKMTRALQEHLHTRVSGPHQPGIGRVRNKFIFEIWIKLEKDPQIIANTKALVKHTAGLVKKTPGLSTAIIQANVDP